MSFTMEMNGETGQASPSPPSPPSPSPPSPPAKRSLELDSEDTSASAHKKARLETSQDDDIPKKEDNLLFQKQLTDQNTQETSLQHPQPRRLPSPLASVSKQLLDPVDVDVDPLDAFVSQWLQSVGSSESTRRRNCRSDSSLAHLRDEKEKQGLEQEQRQPLSISTSHPLRSQPFRSRQTRSAPPDMERKDADGYAIPQTPASLSGSNTRGRPATAYTGQSTATSRSRSGGPNVEDSGYRKILRRNHIKMQRDGLPLPNHVASVVGHVRTKQRDSPEPTDEELINDDDHWAMFEEFRSEDLVVSHYTNHVFPNTTGPGEVLTSRTGTFMSRQVVPFADGAKAASRFCTPAPDLSYGYRRDRAFPNPDHDELLNGMDDEVRATNISSSDTLVFPFFVVEFKGSDGNVWAATNQCLGGMAACVNIAESLKRRLWEAATKSKDGVVTAATIDSTAFSIAMTGTEANMYVSWKQDELNYYSASIDCYTLRRPDEYRRFRRMVRNVVDWGRNERLKAIHRGLDQLLEAGETVEQQMSGGPVTADPGAGPSGQSVRQRSPPSPSDKGSNSGRSKKQRS